MSKTLRERYEEETRKGAIKTLLRTICHSNGESESDDMDVFTKEYTEWLENNTNSLKEQLEEMREVIKEWFRIDKLRVYSSSDDAASFHRSQLLSIDKFLQGKDKG